MKNLWTTKSRLVNETLSMNRMSKRKDDEVIDAYEKLFLAQRKTKRLQNIINDNNIQIDDLNIKIRQSMVEAFGTDLMDISISGMSKFLPYGFNKIK